MYDTPDDVPESVKTNKRYAGLAGYTISEVAEQVRTHGRTDAGRPSFFGVIDGGCHHLH